MRPQYTTLVGFLALVPIITYIVSDHSIVSLAVLNVVIIFGGLYVMMIGQAGTDSS